MHNRGESTKSNMNGSPVQQVIALHEHFNSLRPSDACIRQKTITGLDNGLSPGRRSAPNQYLNHCRNMVNLDLLNKLQWNIKQNSYVFIQENAFESVVCNMAAILSRTQCGRYISRHCHKIVWLKLFASVLRDRIWNRKWRFHKLKNAHTPAYT